MSRSSTYIDLNGTHLEGKSFKGASLQKVNLSGLDLRGANFTNANLEGTDFSHTITGIRPYTKVLIFISALAISLFANFIVMLTGKSVQLLINSPQPFERSTGFLIIAFFFVQARFALGKDVFKTINPVLYVIIILAIILALFMYLSGMAVGLDAMLGSFALILVIVMYFISVVLRSVTGKVATNILLFPAAICVAIFGNSIGGSIGVISIAVTCMVFCERAFHHKNQSSSLHKITFSINGFLGTSFKNADLTKADFSNAEIINTDFTKAKLTDINWSKTKGQPPLMTND
jgi:uncharacterized protein YjbI with pentapeptide repeats